MLDVSLVFLSSGISLFPYDRGCLCHMPLEPEHAQLGYDRKDSIFDKYFDIFYLIYSSLFQKLISLRFDLTGVNVILLFRPRYNDSFPATES
jgi:hypothetical protein